MGASAQRKIIQPITRGDLSCPFILVVDDDDTHRLMLQILARRLKMRVEVASTYDEALQLLSAEVPDLILMDCRMPGKSGLQCTRAVRANAKLAQIPIIAFTACVSDADRLSCLEAGMNDFIAKPFLLDDLSEKLRFWLAQRRASA